RFAGLADTKVAKAAELIAPRKRHTHFTIDQLIDARVSADVIELYRALIGEASPRKSNKARMAKSPSRSRRTKSKEADLLPGAVSRLNAVVPERIAQIEHLYGQLLEEAEARHKIQIEELNAHLAQAEARHKSEVEKFNAVLAQAEDRHKSQVEELNAHLAQAETRHKTEVKKFNAALAQAEARHKTEIKKFNAILAQAEDRHKSQVEEINAH